LEKETEVFNKKRKRKIGEKAILGELYEGEIRNAEQCGEEKEGTKKLQRM